MDTTNAALPRQAGKPALRALEQAGYTSLAHLETVTEAELLHLHGVGPRRSPPCVRPCARPAGPSRPATQQASYHG
jgi:hypothetical protein